MNVIYTKESKRAVFEIQNGLEETLLGTYVRKNPEKIIEYDGFHTIPFKGEDKRYLFVKIDVAVIRDMKKFVRNGLKK